MSIKEFRVVAKLGEGAYSSVYKVERFTDNKIYALKKVKLMNLSDRELENAVNQVRILASIKSPHIIGYKEAFLEGNNLCIVMEFADGCDLYQKIVEYKKKKRYFEESQIWTVLIQITKAMKNLHDLQIFHRDLKSANVFLTKKGQAKLGDMNVSKISKNGLLYTQTGTPYYASPEVWKDQPYDTKSDIWSFGCVIYEMCTLQPPFKAEDMEGLYETVLKGKYPPIPAFYSKQLSSIIRLMLQQNPSKRPSTDKMLRSSLFKGKMRDLGINTNEDIRAELLKTIRIPKKITNLTDRLPKANYDFSKSSGGLIQNRIPTETSTKDGKERERTITLPRLEGMRYNGKSKQKNKKQKRKQVRNSNSMEVNGIKSIAYQPELLERSRPDVRAYSINPGYRRTPGNHENKSPLPRLAR